MIRRLFVRAVLLQLLPAMALAQGYVFGPNVRVNDNPPASAFVTLESPGQHVMAARGDSVYIVWRDDRIPTYAHVYFSRSTDGGATFSPGFRIDDPECAGGQAGLALDDSGTIHVSWLNATAAWGYFTYYSKSTDGGVSFQAPLRACDSLHWSQIAYPSIAVSPSGRNVFIARSEADVDSHSNSTYQIWLSRSTNGGASFISPNTLVCQDTFLDMWDPSVGVIGDSVILVAWEDYDTSSHGRDVLFARSTDGGASFSPGVYLNDTTGDQAAQSDPSVSIDDVGNVFVVWCGVINHGADSGLALAVSRDSGRTFSHERAIQYTHWGGTPSLWASGNGELFLAWEFWAGLQLGDFDEVRFAHSTDAGLTFSVPLNPSDGPRHSNENSPAVTASRDGRVYMAWRDQRNDTLGFNCDVYFSTGNRSAITEGPDAHARDLLEVGSTPGRDWVSIRYAISHPGRVRIEVLDLTGRDVALIEDRVAAPGMGTATWRGLDNRGGKIATGVYFVRCITPEWAQTRKTLFVRD